MKNITDDKILLKEIEQRLSYLPFEKSNNIQISCVNALFQKSYWKKPISLFSTIFINNIFKGVTGNNIMSLFNHFKVITEQHDKIEPFTELNKSWEKYIIKFIEREQLNNWGIVTLYWIRSEFDKYLQE